MIRPRGRHALIVVVLATAVLAYRTLLSRVGRHSDVKVSPSLYRWTLETDSAAFPGSYGFPVFVVHNTMWAFHPQGGWRSNDGRTWSRSGLPSSGPNSGYQRYLELRDAVYGLGTMSGNYLDLQLTSRISRTGGFGRWETVAD